MGLGVLVVIIFVRVFYPHVFKKICFINFRERKEEGDRNIDEKNINLLPSTQSPLGIESKTPACDLTRN